MVMLGYLNVMSIIVIVIRPTTAAAAAAAVVLMRVTLLRLQEHFTQSA